MKDVAARRVVAWWGGARLGAAGQGVAMQGKDGADQELP
jgi:hypothetical protein